MRRYTPNDLITIRNRLGFSQEQMANEIGTSLQNYNQWETKLPSRGYITQLTTHRMRIAELDELSQRRNPRMRAMQRGSGSIVDFATIPGENKPIVFRPDGYGSVDMVADDEPQPIPTGTNYIGADGYLMTWDGEQWRNDGPVSDAVMVCLRMIRSLTDRIAALEGKQR